MGSAYLKNDDSIVIGNRIKSARMLSGHSRTAFSKISGISAATLRTWEEPTNGRYGLTEKGAQRLINALYKCNVKCSKEWLFSGKGHGLSLKNSTVKPLDLDFEVVEWGEEESILKDIAAFKTNNPDPIVAMISDETMAPFFSPGDYVGGCQQTTPSSLKKLIGSNCIINTGDNILIRRIVACDKNKYTVTSLNSSISKPMVRSVQIRSAAEIIWHRWRKKQWGRYNHDE